MHRETNVGIPSLHQGQHLIYVYVRADACCSVHLGDGFMPKERRSDQRQFHNSPSYHRDGSLACVLRRIWRVGAVRGETVMLLIYCKDIRNMSIDLVLVVLVATFRDNCI